jgi:Bacterial nucleoid DNA-binding protein
MTENKKSNHTKKNINTQISKKTGISFKVINKVTEDLIYLLKVSIKNENLNIKNFGRFKTLVKKERLGRNPKTKKEHTIPSSKTLSFSVSRKIYDKMNKI